MSLFFNLLSVYDFFRFIFELFYALEIAGFICLKIQYFFKELFWILYI